MKRIILVTIVLFMMVGLCPIETEAKETRSEMPLVKWYACRICRDMNFKVGMDLFEVHEVDEYLYYIEPVEEVKNECEDEVIIYVNSKFATVFRNGRIEKTLRILPSN